MAATWEGRLFSDTWTWLSATLQEADIDAVITNGDPIRIWLDDSSGGRIGRLLEVVSGANDVLTWLALMDTARVRRPLPPDLQSLFSDGLAMVARSTRGTSYPLHFHAFLSYSHRDMHRAALVVEILSDHGIRVFHDVRDIQAGESILGKIHTAMTQAPRAILLITESYAKSVWAQRELSLLCEREKRKDLVLLPVLLDDVPLPDPVRDIFSIDLRGFSGSEDIVWAKERLSKLIAACT